MSSFDKEYIVTVRKAYRNKDNELVAGQAGMDILVEATSFNTLVISKVELREITDKLNKAEDGTSL